MGSSRVGLSHRGLTMAECVVALGLVTIITLLFLSLFLSARTSGAKGESTARVTALAESEMANWKTRDFAELEALIATPETYEVDYQGLTYDSSITATRLSNDANNPEFRVLHLTLVLEWDEKKQLVMGSATEGVVGQSRTRFEMESLVSAVGAL